MLLAVRTKVFAYTAGLSLASGSAAAGIMAVTKAGSSHVPALADGQQAALDALNLTTNTNLAMAYLRVGRPDKAVYFASKVSHRPPGPAGLCLYHPAAVRVSTVSSRTDRSSVSVPCCAVLPAGLDAAG